MVSILFFRVSVVLSPGFLFCFANYWIYFFCAVPRFLLCPRDSVGVPEFF